MEIRQPFVTIRQDWSPDQHLPEWNPGKRPIAKINASEMQ
jgi:hypothetical protein